jgi:hypothetical protein
MAYFDLGFRTKDEPGPDLPSVSRDRTMARTYSKVELATLSYVQSYLRTEGRMGAATANGICNLVVLMMS